MVSPGASGQHTHTQPSGDPPVNTDFDCALSLPRSGFVKRVREFYSNLERNSQVLPNCGTIMLSLGARRCQNNPRRVV